MEGYACKASVIVHLGVIQRGASASLFTPFLCKDCLVLERLLSL